MSQKLENKLVSALVGITSDGLNRALNALEEAGAIDLTELRSKYSGIGSEYYDVVTKELETTAESSRPALREAIDSTSL